MPTTILQPGRNCEGFIEAGTSGLLIDGRDYYRAFYREACRAESFILISGWQFDSEVALLRGPDRKAACGEIKFLNFLNQLCGANKDLRIYILAWDFSFIFMLEREWVQEWVFNWSTNERLLFRFDDRHPVGASQHQKFTVIDGRAAFLGGMDICAGRWDDRAHLAKNPERTNPDGRAYDPYHDVQAYFTGPVAVHLSGIFKERWRDLTGTEIALSPPEKKGPALPALMDAGCIPIDARRLCLSRTLGQTFVAIQDPVKEIRQLYIDAISAAESLIYIENQYLSSYAVFKSLKQRMEAKDRPRIEVVIMLPKKPQAFVEELSVGVTQTHILNTLRKAARKNKHSLGVYYSAAFDESGREVPVYIHSKLLMVDDRFMTIGSANTTNRSLGLDSELNASFEAAGDRALIESIRNVRAELLSEFCGTEKSERLRGTEGIVGYLDALAGSNEHRIRFHAPNAVFENSDLIKALDEAVFDPERAVIEENVFEMVSPDILALFAEGITALKKWLTGKEG